MTPLRRRQGARESTQHQNGLGLKPHRGSDSQRPFQQAGAVKGDRGASRRALMPPAFGCRIRRPCPRLRLRCRAAASMRAETAGAQMAPPERRALALGSSAQNDPARDRLQFGRRHGGYPSRPSCCICVREHPRQPLRHGRGGADRYRRGVGGEVTTDALARRPLIPSNGADDDVVRRGHLWGRSSAGTCADRQICVRPETSP
jgi:hypothetical protein